jgi:hypothetical protein
MKQHEEEIRREIENGRPFTLVTASGERVKVRSSEHIFLPPFEDENGAELKDSGRSDFFEVWSNGRRKRLVAFQSINIIETQELEANGKEPTR